MSKRSLSSHSGRPHWKHSMMRCGGFLVKALRQASEAFQLKICQPLKNCSSAPGFMPGERSENARRLSVIIRSEMLGKSESARERRNTTPMSPKLSTTLQRIVTSRKGAEIPDCSGFCEGEFFFGLSVSVFCIRLLYGKCGFYGRRRALCAAGV